MRNERPPHAPGTQHRGDHHTRKRLAQPLVQGPPLPLATEQHGIPQATPADGDRLEELTVVILG